MSMPTQPDFEGVWLSKFSAGIRELVGNEVRGTVMEGSERLSSASPRDEVVEWTRAAMERLLSLAGEDLCKEVMLRCACRYPTSSLQGIREAYQETRDLDMAHQMLLEKFTFFLRETLLLDEAVIDTIIGRGWGLAGTRDGSTIVATKIPKSGDLVRYLQETDAGKKRELYCHCPRIRSVLATSGSLTAIYCYCGGGFYKGIWEEILQRPVQVELIRSVLRGDDVCSFRIGLTSHD